MKNQTSNSFDFFHSLFMITLALALVTSGCYDPTADKVGAEAAAAKEKEEVVAEDTDISVPLNADNFDLKFTGSNSAGQTPYGYFYELDGKILLDGDTKQLKDFSLEIDMDSVKAMSETLTEKLKHKGFFQVDEYPKSTFEMTSISDQPREEDPEGTTHVIEGNFKLRDATKSIKIPVKVDAAGDTFKMTSEFKINRKDFGVIYSNTTEDLLIRDDVLINMDIEAEMK